MNLKDKLIQAYQEAENTLSFHQERKESIDRLEEFGFPTVKDEEWKYTNLLPIIKNEYALSAQESIVSKELLNEYILTQTETNIIVFVNGKLNRELSDIDAANATICSLSEAEKNHSAVVKKYWGKALSENPDSLVSLNTALSSEGVFIHVPKGTVVEKPIQIVYFSTNVSSDLFLQTRNLIVIEENAQVQVTERHQNIDQKEVFTNSVSISYKLLE